MATKNLVLFESRDGEVLLLVPTDGETVWLSQAQMAELFGKECTVVAKYIKNAINECEIDPKVVCANFAHTTRHGASFDRVILRRAGSLSVRTGEGCKSAVSRDGESWFFGWQQAHCRRAIPLLPLAQQADVPLGVEILRKRMLVSQRAWYGLSSLSSMTQGDGSLRFEQMIRI